MSKSDFFKGESQSINNQRLLVKSYISVNEELKQYSLREYIDDGYSGKNMNRPGINRLIKNVEEGKIEIIIVKDFSRFSRDYLIMGEWLENIVQKKIRFISINDNYDSFNKNIFETSVNEAFKNIIYDYYSIENSYKIKIGLDKSRAKGKYIASKTLYGYKNINGRLIINEDEGKVVKYIFDSYLEGKEIKDIISGIYSLFINEKYKKWYSGKIYRILRDEQYTGKMIYGKKKSKFLASNNKILCKKEEWKCIEKHHEAIIEAKLFVKVQEKLNNQ